MAQKNETVPFVVALLLTAGILGGGAWWFLNRSGMKINNPIAGVQSSTGRVSSGEKILLPSESTNPDFNQLKQAGVNAIAQNNPAAAVTFFESALQRSRNAPEVLIYLNNAWLGDRKAHTIAVPIPIKTDLNASAEILRGVAQAQGEINRAGGVNGTPIRMVLANDENDPAIAQQIASDWVKDSTIMGMVGHYASDVTLAAGKVYNDGGLVCISPTSTSVELSGFGKFVFRSVPNDNVAARALADYGLKTLKQKNFAVFFNSQSVYSQSLRKEFMKAIPSGGGQVSNEFDFSQPDFNPARAVQQAQDAKVLMLVPNAGTTGGTLDKALQVVQANQRRAIVLAGDDAYALKTLEIGREQALGMIVAVPWHIEANAGTPFVQTSRKLWGADVNWRSAMAYDAVQAIAAGLRRNSTRAGVKQALLASDFSAPGASGAVKFLQSGDRSAGIQLVQVVEGKRSGTGYDFMPIPAQ